MDDPESNKLLVGNPIKSNNKLTQFKSYWMFW